MLKMEKDTVVRITIPEDHDAIRELISTKNLVDPFKNDDLQRLLETGVLSISVLSTKKLMGFASFSDHPGECFCNLSGDWTSWLENFVGRRRFECFNTLFIQCFASASSDKERDLRRIVMRVFGAMPLVEFIAILCSKKHAVDECVTALFRAKKTKNPGLVLWQLKRNELIPLTIRTPKLEDYDDIMRLTEENRELLTEHYGPTYPADIAEYRKPYVFAAVAEARGKVVGYVHASVSQINLEELIRNFELEPFHGLRKESENDRVPQPSLKIDSVMVTLPPLCFRQSAYISGNMLRYAWLEMREGDIGFVDDPFGSVNDNDDDQRSVSRASDDSFGILNQEDDNFLPRMPKYNRPAIPAYKGEANCFRLYYCAIEESYATEFMTFIRGAFRKLSRWDYCIMLLPYDVPLLNLHQCFFQVAPRPLSLFPQVLFVFHRAGALQDFRVREGNRDDFPAVKSLVGSLTSKNYLLTDVRDSFTGNRPEVRVVVATCTGTVVGVAVLKKAVNLPYLFSHFVTNREIQKEAESRMEGAHARLMHCVLNPALKMFSKVFLKEAMRITDTEVFFYHIYPSTIPIYDYYYQCGFNLLEDLYPLRPVRPIRYNVEQLGPFAPSADVMKNDGTFATFYINRPLCMMARYATTARIVVIGTSEAGLSFLETLIYRKDTAFRNLFLITPYGLPGEIRPDRRKDAFLPKSVHYDHEMINGLCFHAMVNVVYGRLKSIDRIRKIIQLENGAEVAYDYLVLTTGLQYQREIKHILPTPTLEMGEPFDQKLRIQVDVPKKTVIKGAENIFAMNDAYDAAVALTWLKTKFHVIEEGQVVVYGNTVEAYTCIAGILEAGVSAANITLVKGGTSSGTQKCFESGSIERYMTTCLENVGVTIFPDSEVEVPDDFSELISEVYVCEKDSIVPIKCKALFICNERSADYAIYNACFRAQVDFDGRLLVDERCMTNDDRIYGAGTLVRLYDRCCAPHYAKVEFSSKEMGEIAARNILERLPKVGSGEEEQQQQQQRRDLHHFTEPIVTWAALPCGYNYLHVRGPRYKYEDLKWEGLEMKEKESRFFAKKIVSSTIERCLWFTEKKKDGKVYESESTEEEEEKEEEEVEQEVEQHHGMVTEMSRKSILKLDDETVMRNAIEWFETKHAQIETPPVSEEEVEVYDPEAELELMTEGRSSVCEEYQLVDDYVPPRNRKMKDPRTRKPARTPKRSNNDDIQVSPKGTSPDKSPTGDTRKKVVVEEDGEHFSLGFNEFCKVDTITCFTKRPIKATNLVQLYGLHYAYLNKVLERFAAPEPSELFEFFDQAWSMALYHYAFKKFCKEMREYTAGLQPRNYSDEELYGTCYRFAYDEHIKKNLEDYFEFYDDVLPMYAPVPS